ncbi:MAG: N-acetylmuramoyl-L-alanine amidase [Gammaproteobacteria bacterium]|nr:N-acetylmuramoyl-L-alanine amidase [Gammaproteobacteria bacterium]
MYRVSQTRPQVLRLLAGLCIWLAGQAAVCAEVVDLKGVRLWAAPDHTRVVFDTSSSVTHKIFSLQNPDRLVIDVASARVATSMKAAQTSGGLVKGVRTAHKDKDTLRIVLDLTQGAKPKAFSLKPNKQYGHRLVIDLYELDQGGNLADSSTVSTPASKPDNPAPVKTTTAAAAASVTVSTASLRELVIAIDAGHGGEDPGAIGRRGTREKTVVLEIARKLAALIEKEPGMRPVLIREGDYYVGLRQRIDKARKHNADLFLSIHADAFRDQRARGSSVFVLSRNGASSEMARWIAAKENAADLAGGVSLDDKDDVLAGVLLDLSQSASIAASHEVASNMLTELKRLGKTHKSSVQRAGFVVLKSPDIPSILVETAFISNPAEEDNLRNSKHQAKLAQAMLSGIRDYFDNHPPPGTLRVARKHTVKSGDTLSEIAAAYQVNLNSLRGFNSLKSDQLRVGDTLRIPPMRGS